MPSISFKVDLRDAKKVVDRGLKLSRAPMKFQRIGVRFGTEMKASVRAELVGSYWQASPGSRIPWAPLVKFRGLAQKNRKPFGGGSGTFAKRWSSATRTVDDTSVTLRARLPVPKVHVGGTGLKRTFRETQVRIRSRGHQIYLGTNVGLWKPVGGSIKIPSRPMGSSLPRARLEKLETVFVRAWG